MKIGPIRTLIFLVIFAPPVRAEWRFGGGLGVYLPSRMAGVDEVMKTQVLRGGYFAGGLGGELTYFHSAEDGATVNYFLGSLSKELKVPDIDFFTVLVAVGLNQTYIRARGGAYARSGGIHAAASLFGPLGGNWGYRTQLTILNGPGRAALFDLGIVYHFGRPKPSGEADLATPQ